MRYHIKHELRIIGPSVHRSTVVLLIPLYVTSADLVHGNDGITLRSLA